MRAFIAVLVLHFFSLSYSFPVGRQVATVIIDDDEDEKGGGFIVPVLGPGGDNIVVFPVSDDEIITVPIEEAAGLFDTRSRDMTGHELRDPRFFESLWSWLFGYDNNNYYNYESPPPPPPSGGGGPSGGPPFFPPARPPPLPMGRPPPPPPAGGSLPSLVEPELVVPQGPPPLPPPLNILRSSGRNVYVGQNGQLLLL